MLKLRLGRKNKTYLIPLLFLSVFTVPVSVGQELPPITNYQSSVYKAHSQNWDIGQNVQNILYSANSEGLLEYDGANWRLYSFPNGQIVRSILCDTTNEATSKIYVGGFGEFGYWQNSPNGKMAYHSLSKGLKLKAVDTEEIWHILKTREAVYFQSFSYIYKYDGKKITETRAPGNFMYLRNVKGRLLIQLIKKGIYELKGQNFMPLSGTEKLGGASVSSLLDFDGDKLLIATAKHGLFIWDKGEMHPWELSFTSDLTKNILNKAIRLNNGNYAFGTILRGVYIMSPKGDLLNHFHSQNGLQNNTILAMSEDSRQNLWLGLDKGIDLIRLASPVTSHTAPNSNLGTTYAAAVWKDRLYVGSNSGLFIKKWQTDESLKLIPGLQGQVWDLKIIDNQLICGHNDGTFRITDQGVERISSIPGGWVLLPVEEGGEKFLIQGTYTGLHIYRKDHKGVWRYSNPVKNVPPIPIRELVRDKNGLFWIAHAYKGLFTMRLDKGLTRAEEWKEYKAPEDLPNDYSLEITPWKNRMLIRSGTQFFTPDKNGKLIPDKEFGEEDEFYKLRLGTNGEWFKVFRNTTLLNKPNGSSYAFDVTLVKNAENIVSVTPRHYLFCLADGYVLYDRSRKDLPEISSIAPLIRKVVSLTNLSVFFSTVSGQKIPAEIRSLRINYSLPVYGNEIRYQYRLIGLVDSWSEGTTQSYADFTNLGTGKYQFQVKNSFNNLMTSYSFTILPIWYETLWAKLVFIASGVILVMGLIYWQERRLASQRKKILQEQEGKLRQQKLAAEKKIIEIRNESLQNEIKNKSQQLSNVAINVVRKNEILEEIRDELQHVKGEMGQELPNIHYNKLLNSIERNVSGKEDWKLFEDNFDEVHDEFFKRIKQLCPSVSPSELRLAACLRMNLSTKEMAPALGISNRGVEIKRYRLRKKLGLAIEINLIEFMMNI